MNDGPVFIVACYVGKKKPLCSNEYLRRFVCEICDLRSQGITVQKKKIYRFVLDKLLMDAPARAFIIGIFGHNSKNPCPRCDIEGVSYIQEGLASTDLQRIAKRKALCFVDMDAPPRQSSDFMLNHTLPECNPNAGCNHEPFNWDFFDEEDDEDENFVTSLKANRHHKYRTLLTNIPGFDLVQQVVLDYMHYVCIGVMPKIIAIIYDNLLSDNKKMLANERMLKAREFCPVEFQRKNLNHLKCLKCSKQLNSECCFFT